MEKVPLLNPNLTQQIPASNSQDNGADEEERNRPIFTSVFRPTPAEARFWRACRSLYGGFAMGDLTVSFLEITPFSKMPGLRASRILRVCPHLQKDPSQKYRGDVSFFICTKPGRGSVVLSDESLLNPETGLPN